MSDDLILNPADSRLALAPLPAIKTALDRLFGANEWLGYEPETISIELGMVMDELLLDKIQVLQIILHRPEVFYEDPAFMLYATDVINNNVADFDTVPIPTSLELAFAIEQVAKVLASAGKTPSFGIAIEAAVAWLLRQEGYSEPVEPFSFVSAELLERGQTKEDTEAKKKAIAAYIKHMESV